MSIDLSNKNPVKPVLSASIILVREKEEELQILMAERHAGLSFAAGALVFPGGRIDEEDYPAANTPGDDDILLEAAKIAALRELQEETQLIVSSANIESMCLFAHWITPKESPKRFDTRFFLAHYDGASEPKVDGGEIVRAQWLTPQQILTGETAGQYGLMFPTRLIVRKILMFNDYQSLLKSAQRDKVVEVTPQVEIRQGEMWITIPSDAGYDVTEVRRDQIFEFMGPKRS